MKSSILSRRKMLAVASSAPLLASPLRSIAAEAKPAEPAALGGCQLRKPGPAVPVAVDRPRALRPDAASRLGDGRLLKLYDQATWSEGPIWWPSERTLVWSDVIGRRVLGWREDGAVDVLIDATPFTNGNGLDREGRLLHCEHGLRAITRTERDGGRTVLATEADGARLNAPNDLVVASDGAIWFSDPTFGIENPKEGCPAPSESGRTSICRLLPGAREATRMADMNQPNGIAFSPDGRILYASQTPQDGSGELAIFAFPWDGKRLGDRRIFAKVGSGLPDGLAVDRHGWVWSSSSAGVEVFDPNGERVASIPTPHLCSNVAFDAEERRLFITGGDSLWMLALSS